MSITNNVARAKSDYDEVYEAGKKSQYDEFWDAYQSLATTRNYKYGFAGRGWGYKTWYPKFDLHPTAMANCFAEMNTIIPFSMTERLKECGVVFDSSECTSSFDMAFYSCAFSELPTIDMTKTNSARLAFRSNVLEKVTVILPEASFAWNETFRDCTQLTDVVFIGELKSNGMSFSHSKLLTKASIESVINSLSTATSGLSVTFSQTAVNNAFTTAEWNALIATRANWTINLLDS